MVYRLAVHGAARAREPWACMRGRWLSSMMVVVRRRESVMVVVAVMASGWRRRTFNNGRVSPSPLPATAYSRAALPPLHPRLEPLARTPSYPATTSLCLCPLPSSAAATSVPLVVGSFSFSGVALLFHARLVPPTPLVPWSSNTPDYGWLRAERFSLEQAPWPGRRWRR